MSEDVCSIVYDDKQKLKTTEMSTWTFTRLFSVSFAISRENVISITLTVERIGNSNDYIVTLTVTSHVPEYLVVSKDLGVIISKEREEKYPHEQFQWSLMIWSEIASHKEVTCKYYCICNPGRNVCIITSILKVKKWYYGWNSWFINSECTLVSARCQEVPCGYLSA